MKATQTVFAAITFTLFLTSCGGGANSSDPTDAAKASNTTLNAGTTSANCPAVCDLMANKTTGCSPAELADAAILKQAYFSGQNSRADYNAALSLINSYMENSGKSLGVRAFAAKCGMTLLETSAPSK